MIDEFMVANRGRERRKELVTEGEKDEEKRRE